MQALRLLSWYGNGNMEGAVAAVDWLLIAASAVTAIVATAVVITKPWRW